MSYHIQVPLERPLSVKETLDTLAPLGPERLGEGGDWPLGLYLPGLSSRATWIEPEGDGLEVRINTLASREDWDLALRVVEALAPHSIGAVKTESRGELPISALREAYPEDTWEGFAESGFAALKHMISEGRGPMQIPGPRRSLYVGAGLIQALDNHVKLVEALREIQALEFDAEPQVFIREGDPVQITFSILGDWSVGGGLFLSQIDMIFVEVEADELYTVPIEEFKALFEARIRYLDEYQFVIEGFDASSWAQLVALARRLDLRP